MNLMPKLYTLVPCGKCNEVKPAIKERGIEIIEFPRMFQEWTTEQINNAEKSKIFDDLQITAPILVLDNGTKLIGVLRILQWLKKN